MVSALVLIPVVKNKSEVSDLFISQESLVSEILSLARAIDLSVKHHETVVVTKIRPATFFGSGKIEHFAEIIKDKNIQLLVVDYNLSAVQQSNLEKKLNVKVIDRTALIIEIFGERARTKEGALQVELAQLTYQKGRIIRSWTHLERQRGGAGFLGGPGEKQLEADRRHLQEKINAIKKQLAFVVKTREIHRKQRKKTPYPIVVLVGYTNAGKSSLFNKLTNSTVLAKDMLFATLDPTLRALKLPSGNTVILSDTVGFISNLPMHLIAAFRATLEEVCGANLIIHVRDISNPEHHRHKQEVLKTLRFLNIETSDPNRIIEVWNKIDLLEDNQLKSYQMAQQSMSDNNIVSISATEGKNLDSLLHLIDKKLFGELHRYKITLQVKQLNLLDIIYKYGSNIVRRNLDNGAVSVFLDLLDSNIFALRRRGLTSIEKIS